LAVAHELSSDFEILLLAGEPLENEESAAFLLKKYTGFNVQILPSIKRAILPVADFKAFVQIKKIIHSFQPQIIHTHGSKPGVVARMAAIKCKVPVIVHTYHGHVFHSYFNSLITSIIIRVERWLAKRTTFLIAINNHLLTDLSKVYRIASEHKIIINRLGLETEVMTDSDGSKRQEFRNQFHITPDTVVVGIVGRLVPIKNHQLFLELVQYISQTSTLKVPVRFFIIGDGEERLKLQHLLTQMKISFSSVNSLQNEQPTVIFTSWRKDMDLVYAGLDLVVLTSFNEGTPVSIMEAMAAGKPVVSSKVGGIPELFEQNRNGYFFETKKQFFQQIESLVQNPQLRKELGNHALSFAANHFSLKQQAAELKSAFLSSLPHP
jgi:glycosyltransferase involved in cell wall biosynthesis